jgi:hypothetical protein
MSETLQKQIESIRQISNDEIKERMRTASKKDNKLAIKLIYAVRVSALVSPVSFVMLLMAAVNPSLNIS